jgi:hypothetical protein
MNETGHTVRYLVETSDGESFALEREAPLFEGRTFTHEGSTYTARFIEPGRDDFDAVIKADLEGSEGVGQVGSW